MRTAGQGEAVIRYDCPATRSRAIPERSNADVPKNPGIAHGPAGYDGVAPGPTSSHTSGATPTGPYQRGHTSGTVAAVAAQCQVRAGQTHPDGRPAGSHMHYLPLSPGLFSILAGVWLLVAALIQVGILRYAYARLGVGPGAVLLLLLGSLLGTYFNIPVVELPGQPVLTRQVVDYYGMRYAVPIVVDWPGTVIAVNVGGALVPAVVSLWLIAKNELWVPGAIATTCVAALVHMVAQPIPGFGIAMPVFVPGITAGVVAIILSRRYAAPLAYIGGSMGTLIGADLLNLGAIRRMGAPVASIGGAGTFDGIFLTGILAVLIASLSGAVPSTLSTVRR
jgi:uncharacterized membrane protein